MSFEDWHSCLFPNHFPYLFKTLISAVTKTTRVFNFRPLQVTLMCLSAVPVEVKCKILHSIIKVSCWSLEFWSVLCCFYICCHILQCSWWQFPTYPVLSAPWKMHLLRTYSFISFSFLISHEIVQNIKNTSKYWCKYINSQHFLEVNRIVYVLPRQFSTTLQSRVLSSCFGNLGPDDEEDDRSRVINPLYDTFSDSDNNPIL